MFDEPQQLTVQQPFQQQELRELVHHLQLQQLKFHQQPMMLS